MSNEQENTQDEESYDVVNQLLSPDTDKDISDDDFKTLDEKHTVAGGDELHYDDGEEPEETPEETTDADEPVEDKNEETALRDKLKFMQTSYQKQTELLKQASPELYNEIQSKLKAERGKVQEVDTGDEDDPYLKEIKNGFTRLQQEQHMQLNAEKYAQEYRAAETALSNFVTENNISEDKINEAVKAAADMGFDVSRANETYALGVPSKAAKYIMEKLQNSLLQDYLQNKTASVEADVANKAEAIKRVAQPRPGALPEPKPKSKEEKLLESMRRAGRNESAVKELFGK